MAYKLKINYDNVYDLKTGFIYKDELNETLDSATVQFKTYGEEIDCESFDTAEIYDSASKISSKRLLVDSCDDEIYSFNEDGNDHTYTMLLFSQTKELERVTLPNCSITQPIITGIPKKTVWDEINRFLTLYMPKIKVYNQYDKFVYERKYSIDREIRIKFSAITCPEMQWNTPTLREVLTDLFSTADCIPVVKNNILTFFDLKNLVGQEIDTTKLNYSKKSFGSNDYVGELTINMKNAVGKGKTVVCEKKSLRCESATFVDTNAVFITQHPIYNIVSCKISYYYRSTADDIYNPDEHVVYHKEVDITDFVVEQGIFEIANGGRYTGNDINIAKGFRHYLLHYRRGDNKIEGWGTTQKSGPFWFNNDVPTIGWIVNILGQGELSSDSSSGYEFLGRNLADANQITGIAIDLVYETLAEHSMHVGKYLPNRHPENRMFDNQTSSYVDVQHQSIFEYAKVNRLGNKIREIRGEYFNESDIPQLGDKIGDEVLFSREIQYNEDSFSFIGYLTPNYVLRDYYTGVQAKRRSWQLASGEEALTRVEILKRYLEFSFSLKTDKISDFAFKINRFINGVDGHSSGYGFNCVLLMAYDKNGVVYPSQTHAYQLDLDKAVQGMSLCFNFGFIDNVSADYYVEYDSAQDLYRDNLYKYCDNNGETDSFEIFFVSEIDPADGDFTWDYDGHTYYNPTSIPEVASIFDKVTKKPAINVEYIYLNNGIILDKYAYIYKDNREILYFSMQFEYCSDTPDIVVTPRFIEMCVAFSNGSVVAGTDIGVYYSTSETYDLKDTLAKGTLAGSSAQITVIDDILNASISSGIVLPTGTVSWGIADSSGNLLLGVNGNRDTVYVNHLLSRDDKIYYSFGDQYPIGDLSSTQEQLDEAYQAHTPDLGNFRIGRRAIGSLSLERLQIESITKEELEDWADQSAYDNL